MLGHYPISALPISGITDAQITQTQTLSMRFATRTMTTRATDAPAHECIDGRIKRGLRLERHLTEAEGGQFGALIETRRDDIYLNNDDGRLDYLVNEYAADGRTMRLLIGATEIVNGYEQPQPYANFVEVYKTVAGPWTFEHDTVKLRIESLTNRLQNRLQPLVYAGTGGAQGTADMAGLTFPTALGSCLNVPAQLIDPWILTFQLHGGQINAVTAVYDAGISVPFSADYASYAALEAATVPSGSYATSLAAGVIRLGTIPTGQVTADVQGKIDAVNGSYVQHHASVLRMVLRDYGFFVGGELDLSSFTAYDAIQPAVMGLFLPAGDQSTVQEVAERIAFSGGAFVGQDRSGLFRVQRLDRPAPGDTVHWVFDDRDILSIERLDLPYGVPWKAWGVGYQRNWTVQGDADLVTNVSQERRQFLKAELRYAYVQNAAVTLRHASSSGAPLRQALYRDSADAQAEAERLSGLYDVGCALYQFVVKTVLFSVEIGHITRIIYHRWDLTGGKNFVVVGVEDDADLIETRLTVYG